MFMTRGEGISEVLDGPGHVVILGAGASIAANEYNPLPSGKKLPSMDSLIEDVGLAKILKGANASSVGQNFEAIYSQLHLENPESKLVRSIESTVYEYFAAMELPPTPILYDYLILSLRPKDLIATFNWDPFLFQAFSRNRNLAGMPHLSFLHGSVSIGYSPDDQRTGPAGWISKSSGNEYVPTKLLYPVTQKNYTDDVFISREWNRLRRGLAQAKRVTIFGYGAPDTDVEAIDLMSEFWSGVKLRDDEQIEVIDTQPGDFLRQRWNRFIFEGHAEFSNSYFNSSLALFPRRSGESYLHQFHPATEAEAMQETNQIPERFEALNEMQDWHRSLIEAETLHRSDIK